MEATFTSNRKPVFAELPEPPTSKRPVSTVALEDRYLTALDNYINQLGLHIQKIQDEETVVMGEFTMKLESLRNKSPNQRSQKEDEAREIFVEQLDRIRRKRKAYRQMEQEALTERQRMLDSIMLQKEEEDLLRRKLLKLDAIPDEDSVAKDSGKSSPDLFAGIFLVVQVLLIVLYGVAVEFEDGPAASLGAEFRIDNDYSFFINSLLFTVVGFGLLLSFLKKYSYSGMAYTLLIVAFGIQWAVLTNGFFDQAEEATKAGVDWEKIPMTIATLTQALYAVVAVLVTFGVTLGKASPLQLLFITVFEIIAYSFNRWVVLLKLDALDPGGGVTVHLFGAIFGLTVAFLLGKPFHAATRGKCANHESSYSSDLFALMGTLFLWVLWPSWNGAFAPNGTQHRVVMNTVFALIASNIFGFLTSRTLRHRKYDIHDIQNATLAGGVASGSLLAVQMAPAAALLTGAVAAILSVLGFIFVQPILERRFALRLYDTKGAFNLHGLPGLVAGLGGIIAAGVAHDSNDLFGTPLGDVFPDEDSQAGYQALMLVITIGLAFVTGLFVGAGAYLLGNALGETPDSFYTDEYEFIVPSDFERESKHPINAVAD